MRTQSQDSDDDHDGDDDDDDDDGVVGLNVLLCRKTVSLNHNF